MQIHSLHVLPKIPAAQFLFFQMFLSDPHHYYTAFISVFFLSFKMANTGHFMVKQGNMKLIDFGRTHPFEHYQPQLFDLEVGISESCSAINVVLRSTVGVYVMDTLLQL